MSSVNKIKNSTRAAEKALVSALSKTVLSMLTLKLPFLAWPVLKHVFEYILDRALFWLSQEGIILFNRTFISIRVGADAAKLVDAINLGNQAKEEGASDEDLDIKDNDIREALRDFVRYGRNPL